MKSSDRDVEVTPSQVRQRRRTAASCFAGSILAWSVIATAQQEPIALEDRKAELEVQKLELEIARLAEDRAALPAWVTGILGLLVGAAGTAASVWAARRATLGALDQSVHEKRLELYPRLVEATAHLALYFPPAKSVGPNECRVMGEALRTWYFAGGGILLSVEARDAYFKLVRALTRASLAAQLSVPAFPQDAEDISAESVDRYKAELARERNLDDVDEWVFGGAGSETSAHRFKDFVFLQRLSSNLRTKLSEDLRSRRRPAT